jgi:hypothetical protein
MEWGKKKGRRNKKVEKPGHAGHKKASYTEKMEWGKKKGRRNKKVEKPGHAERTTRHKTNILP